MIWDISGDTNPTAEEDPTSLAAPLLSRMWGRMEAVGSNNKNTISQTSNAAPALCSHCGQLFLAWRDSSTGRINFKASSDDGVHFAFPYELLDSSETSPVLVSHNRLNVKSPPQFGLHFGWQGTSNHQLNFAMLRLYLEGGTFGGIEREVGKITLSTMTSSAPSMASLAGAIFVAWTDQETNQTIVAYSVDNEKTLRGAMSLLPASTFPPALATLNGGLFIAWTATSTGMVTVAKINVSFSASGKVSSIEGLAGPVATGQASSGAPAICGHNGLLAVACRGPGADADMRLLLSANEGASFSDELAWPDSSELRTGAGVSQRVAVYCLAWSRE